MYEIWFSNRPVMYAGEVIDLVYGKGHAVVRGYTLCGKPVGGPRWSRPDYLTGSKVDCQRCVKAQR